MSVAIDFLNICLTYKGCMALHDITFLQDNQTLIINDELTTTTTTISVTETVNH